MMDFFLLWLSRADTLYWLFWIFAFFFGTYLYLTEKKTNR